MPRKRKVTIEPDFQNFIATTKSGRSSKRNTLIWPQNQKAIAKFTILNILLRSIIFTAH